MTAFTEAARNAVHRGVPTHRTAGFVTQLRKVGVALTGAAEGEELRLEQQLSEVTAALEALQAATPDPVADHAEIALTDGPPSRPPAPSAAILSPTIAADSESGPTDLADSWIDYESMSSSLGQGESSLEELLSGAPGTPDEAPEGHLVEIGELCYSGSAAIGRAHDIQSEIQEALAVTAIDRPALNDLVEELLDLVELGQR